MPGHGLAHGGLALLGSLKEGEVQPKADFMGM